MRHNKKAQVTVFIVIAVVILGALASFFIYKNISQKGLLENENLDDNSVVLVESTLDCFSLVYSNALTIAGFQGGYTNVKDGLYDGYTVLPYYYKQGTLNIPTISTIETELANYVDEAIPYCINYQDNILELENFGLNLTRLDSLEQNYLGYTMDFNKHNTKVKIHETKVTFTTDLDLSISKEDGTQYSIDFSKYPVNYESDLLDMHEIASYIATSLKEDSEALCLTCINDLASQKELTVEITNYQIPQDERIVISNNLDSIPPVFQYLNKYSEKSEENEAEF